MTGLDKQIKITKLAVCSRFAHGQVYFIVVYLLINIIPGGGIATQSKQNVTDRYLRQFNDWVTGWKTKGLSVQ